MKNRNYLTPSVINLVSVFVTLVFICLHEQRLFTLHTVKPVKKACQMKLKNCPFPHR